MMENSTTDHARNRRSLNRILIVLSVAALLGGLLLEQERETLLNATLLCFSCLGLG